MSDVPDQTHERLPWGWVLLVAVGALLTFTIAGIAAAALQASTMGGIKDRQTTQATSIGVAQVGIVEPRIIELEDRALKRHAERKAQLEEYGWVDRGNGVIRIPVERGMELVVEGK
jgi:hypothetical protein